MLINQRKKQQFYLDVACALSLPKVIRELAWNRYKKVKAKNEGLS